MVDFSNLKRIIVICGHYGCGKTNLALNLALELAEKGEEITLVDLDIVNPYFRSSDYKTILEEKGIHIISPCYAGTNLDTPSLSAEINTVFINKNRRIIFDVGGDDAGAFALGRYSSKILQDDYSFIYVVNKYRNLTQTPEQAVEILKEIKNACKLVPTYIINNSHLQNYTTVDTIKEAYQYGHAIADAIDIPLLCTTAPYKLKDIIINDVKDVYYVKQIVKPPFE
ncbi:MAG: ParA family protein [Acutalibacteraceae bacterium]|nr:ParA family protein [Acutalibacteraceae bacterium]